MIALGIRYLSGYCAATNLARQRPEWPVHPGRVFMAMAAAHYETGGDPVERAALEWIERQDAPAMLASGGFERTTTKAYVPVNDDPRSSLIARSRQERSFPKIWLESDTAFLTWSATPSAAVRDGLEKLCPKVTRIGHSSSLVQVWVVVPGEEPESNWVPQKDGAERMRVASPGSLATLERDFNEVGFRRWGSLQQELRTAKGKAKSALKKVIETEFPSGKPAYRRPQIAKWEGYRPRHSEACETIVDGPFDQNFLVLTKLDGRNLGLEATQQLTGALRNAVMKAASRAGDPPEWVSGHTADRKPSLHSHLAFFPLAFVDDKHADGHVMGVGIAVPRDLHLAEGARASAVRAVFGPLFFNIETGDEQNVKIWNRYWTWTLDRERRERPPLSLQAETWTRPSRTWASVTPVVLHHYPKKSSAGDVERIVREAFASALLPQPEQIVTRAVSRHTGAGDARSMPKFEEGGANLSKYQTHVVVRFRNKVRGPILVGRGRFRGYGLFRPYEEEGYGT